MGLFDRFKRRPAEEPGENTQAAQNAWPGVILEIAAIISNGDEAVLQEVAACTSDPAGYFAAHQERYEERSVYDANDREEIQWISLNLTCMSVNWTGRTQKRNFCTSWSI